MKNQQEIIEMFNVISPTYDRLNRILSFGIDRSWRKNGCERVLTKYVKDVDLLVDVATGTGDLLLFWQGASEVTGTKIGKYIGVDPAVKMLEFARQKVPFATFFEGQANAIPLEDNSADIISISYGIRNVVDLDGALREFHRVLKPNGVLMILEFMSHSHKSFVDRLMMFYMKKILPAIGRLISKDKRAYTYLPESIEAFLTSQIMLLKLENAGFKVSEMYDETFKISTRFVAIK